MGLIGIGEPQFIYTDFLESPNKLQELFNSSFVIVATTTEEVIKLYYSEGDSGSRLKDLLMANSVNESTALAIVKAVGIFVTTGNNGDDPASLAKQLPGVDLKAIHPKTKEEDTLFNIVISLNDVYKWKREDIADWIESAFDTKDIAFEIPGEVKGEKGVLSESTKVVTIKRLL